MMWLLYCCGCDFVHDKRLEKRRRQFWPYQAALQYLSRLLDSLWMIWQRRFGITLENRPLILSDFSFICSNVQEKKSWRVLSRKISTSWVVKKIFCQNYSRLSCSWWRRSLVAWPVSSTAWFCLRDSSCEWSMYSVIYIEQIEHAHSLGSVILSLYIL